jgi:hypothetical protein
MCKIYDKVENKREVMTVVNMEREKKFPLTLRPTRSVALKVGVKDVSLL